MPDGRVNKCKECNRKDVQDNYSKKIEYYKLYEKKGEQNLKEKQKWLFTKKIDPLKGLVKIKRIKLLGML